MYIKRHLQIQCKLHIVNSVYSINSLNPIVNTHAISPNFFSYILSWMKKMFKRRNLRFSSLTSGTKRVSKKITVNLWILQRTIHSSLKTTGTARWETVEKFTTALNNIAFRYERTCTEANNFVININLFILKTNITYLHSYHLFSNLMFYKFNLSTKRGSLCENCPASTCAPGLMYQIHRHNNFLFV